MFITAISYKKKISYYVDTGIKTGATSSKLIHMCNVDEPGVLQIRVKTTFTPTLAHTPYSFNWL